jgi:hypothetical protein
VSERKAFLLRISPDLWESLEQWAADELRSVNGQIEFLLAAAVKEAGRTVGPRPEVAGETEPPPNEES